MIEFWVNTGLHLFIELLTKLILYMHSSKILQTLNFVGPGGQAKKKKTL